jgi:hypothetical protein
MIYTDSSSEYFLRFSPLDIAALQYMYGPSTTERTGNDTYSINTFGSNFIWDGGGIDELSATSAYTSCTIYLTPGYWGCVGTSKASSITSSGQITVNFGTVIENLTGSQYTDALYGNEAGNTINGGAGNDVIEGWAGDDTLIGGLGDDRIDGGDGVDVASFNGLRANYLVSWSSPNSSFTVISNVEGTDTLVGIETLMFTDLSVSASSFQDTVAPAIAFSASKASLSVGESAKLTFTLSEASTTFTASDVTVTGGTLSNFSGSGTTYTALFTPTANSTTSGVIRVASGVFTDAAGNVNADGSDANNAVTITVNTLSPNIPDDFSATITTSGAVVVGSSTDGNIEIVGDKDWFQVSLLAGSTYLFDLGGADSSQGTLGVDSATPYLRLLSPSGNLIESSISGGANGDPRLSFQPISSGTYYLEASTLFDNGTGTYKVSASQSTIPDFTPPAIALSASKTSLGVGDTANLTFTLNEASTTFTASDVTVTGGTLSGFSGSGTTYTALFTPTANSTTSGVVRVGNGVFTDATGNANADGSDTNNTVTMTVNTVTLMQASATTVQSNGRVVVIVDPAQWTSSSNSAQFSILFNSSEYSFVSATMVGSGSSSSSSQITGIGNSGSARVSLNMSNGSSSGQFQIIFAPTSSSPDTFSATVSSYLFNGISSQLEIPSLSSPDFLAPTIAINSSETQLKAWDTAQITFTLSEASTTFTTSDVTATGGTLSNFSGSGTTYTALFTPNTNSTTSGVVRVTSGVFTDAAGNANSDGSDTNNAVTMTVDTIAPAIALSARKASLSVGESATLTFTLSEASTTFTASDVTVTGGILSNFAGSGTAYTALFTPATNSTTNGVVRVTSGVFTDAAGNANSDGSDANNAVTMTVDTIAPAIALSASKASLGVGESATLTFTLSEASTTFTASDVTVRGGILSNFAGSGTAYTALFTPDTNSIISGVVRVVSGVFTDAAANVNADGSDANNTVTMTVDTVPVVVTKINTLSVIVDKGVLGNEAVLLKDLKEVTTTLDGSVQSHTVEYAGTVFGFAEVDPLITTVTRDGEFIQEFRVEIAQAYPGVENILYADAVAIVGVANIDQILLGVAGFDGDFVS